MKISSLLFFTFILLLIETNLTAQNPNIIWSKTYGGSMWDNALKVEPTSDGGFIICGFTESNDGDIANFHGGDYDGWVIKLDADGNLQWEKTYGGSDLDEIASIIETKDHGFLFVGQTQSSDGDVIGNNGASDAWVVKLDSIGNIKWQHCYGGSKLEVASDVILNSLDSYIIVGYTQSIDGDLSSNYIHGNTDLWLLNIDSNQNIVWSKTYGGTGFDSGTSVCTWSNGGYVISGITNKGDGDISNSNYHDGDDFWLLKVDDSGNLLLSRCYGGTSNDEAISISTFNEKWIYIGGDSRSNDGDISNHHGTTSSYDWSVFKVDSNGNIIWQKSLGGTSSDFLKSVHTTSDGEPLISGYTNSSNGDVSYNHSEYNADGWLVTLDSLGNILWQNSYGGTLADACYDAIKLADGTYVFTGTTSSNDFDVDSNKGFLDYWIVKLSPATIISASRDENGIVMFPNPAENLFSYLNKNSKGKLCITDMLGNIVFESLYFKNEVLAVDVSKFARGIYLISSGDENNFSMKKIILQ